MHIFAQCIFAPYIFTRYIFAQYLFTQCIFAQFVHCSDTERRLMKGFQVWVHPWHNTGCVKIPVHDKHDMNSQHLRVINIIPIFLWQNSENMQTQHWVQLNSPGQLDWNIKWSSNQRKCSCGRKRRRQSFARLKDPI